MQTINADGTKLDMKDEDHGKRAHSWINDTQDFSQMPTADDIRLDLKDEGYGLYHLIGYFGRVTLTGLQAY